MANRRRKTNEIVRIVVAGVAFVLIVGGRAVRAICEESQSTGQTAVIRFFAPVTEQTVNSLLKTVDEQMKAGATRIVLLISSPGGNVFYGISAYNYLKGLPIEVVTHNFGNVDSIAAVLYCAGSKRYSVPQGEFLLHGLAASFPGGVQLEQAIVEQGLKQMQNQTDSIARVISTTTGEQLDTVKRAIADRTVLSADQAKSWGLVQEIKANLIPPGTQVISIQTSEATLPAAPKLMRPESLAKLDGIDVVAAPLWTGFTKPESLSFTTPVTADISSETSSFQFTTTNHP